MNETKNKYFRKHFLKAMQILDMLNDLMSDIDFDKDWASEFEEPLEEGEEALLSTLYYGIEDTEAQLSESLYESELYEIYEESEEQ